MKVKLAKTLGYCGGVKRAVDLIYRTLEEVDGDKIIMDGPIIHNKTVIEDLKSKGVSLLEDNCDLMEKKVVIRAHGITPKEESTIISNGGEIVDGTCPIVKSSQNKIKRYYDEGYYIVICGDKGHAEVIGLVGQAVDRSIVVASVEDLKSYIYQEKTVLISQTTFSKPEFFCIEKELRRKCPSLISLCTICGATKHRQEATIDLAKEVDAIVVVGGLNSSNTKRLKMVAEEFVPAWLIEGAEDIPDCIKEYKTVGVAAGASTPSHVIDRVVDALSKI